MCGRGALITHRLCEMKGPESSQPPCWTQLSCYKKCLTGVAGTWPSLMLFYLSHFPFSALFLVPHTLLDCVTALPQADHSRPSPQPLECCQRANSPSLLCHKSTVTKFIFPTVFNKYMWALCCGVDLAVRSLLCCAILLQRANSWGQWAV